MNQRYESSGIDEAGSLMSNNMASMFWRMSLNQSSALLIETTTVVSSRQLHSYINPSSIVEAAMLQLSRYLDLQSTC